MDTSTACSAGQASEGSDGLPNSSREAVTTDETGLHSATGASRSGMACAGMKLVESMVSGNASG